MIIKRFIGGVLIVIALACVWQASSRKQAIPEKKAAPDPSQSSTRSASTAIGRPQATKRQKAEASQAGLTIEISQGALELGQATQSVGIKYEAFSKFTPKDVDYLNQCYRARTNPLDRMELTRVLAAIGNEETVQLFIHCLNEEQAGKVFKEQEAGIEQDPEFALWSTVTALGVLASKSDMAFEFLKRSVRPEYWNTAINWQSHRGDRSAGLMTDWAIQAVGNTGRREAREILTELLRNPPTPWPPSAPEARRRTFRSAIISAAFRLDYIEQYGQEVAKAGKGPDPRYAYPIWEKSEKGKVWLQK